MVPSEADRYVVPDVIRNVPGGGGPIWRLSSKFVLSTVAFLCKGFLKSQKNVRVDGIDNFLRILDMKRDRGVLTVSNHFLDDPVLWGVLPSRILTDQRRIRWALGASDICFTNPLYSLFFSLGNTLPVNRHAPYRPRGINQPAMNHTIALLNPPHDSWVHIFPEARIYQAPELPMRFFKMGVSKLILEPEKAPYVIPMFHSGMETVMVEERIPPQFLPSIGKDIHIRFGEPIPFDVLENLRARWHEAREHPTKSEVRHLRIETAELVRAAVNDVRSSMGFPPEPPNSNDPKSFPPITTPPRKDIKGWLTRLRERFL